MNLETLNAIDGFVWGPPLANALIGTGIMLTVRLKLLRSTPFTTGAKLIFTTQNQGEAISTAFKALLRSLSRYGEKAAGTGTSSVLLTGPCRVAQVLFSGCGWLRLSAPSLNMLKAVWLSNTVQSTKARGSAELCTTLKTAWARNINPGPFSSRSLVSRRPFFTASARCPGKLHRRNYAFDSRYSCIRIHGVDTTILVAAVTIGGLQSITKASSSVPASWLSFYVISTVPSSPRILRTDSGSSV